MEYRNFGNSGFKVPVLSLGTGTFGGTTAFFQKWGETGEKEATRLIDISLERGINLFDTANVYSLGEAERILGKTIRGRRDRVLISTKVTFAMGAGPNEKGSSRFHIIKAVNDSLKRLGTDYVDILFMHGFDSGTPIVETLSTLDVLVKNGKTRYIGVSNFAAWQLMKSLAIAEKHHFEKYIIYQGYYSVIGRDYEQELMPLIEDQRMGLMVWSPLGWGRLTGKISKDGLVGEGRVKSGGLDGAPPVDDNYLFSVLEALGEIAEETGKSIAQVSINWLLQNKTVSNIIVGARNEQQLLQNIEAVGWTLSPDQVSRINKVSESPAIYPHWVGER